MKLVDWKRLRIVVGLAFAFLAFALLDAAALKFMDFPCFARVSYEYATPGDTVPVRCLQGSRGSSAPTDSTGVEAFLTSVESGASGGGCLHRIAGGPVLTLREVRGLRLRREGDTLWVDGRGLVAGDSVSRVSYLHWNPWVKWRFRLRYIGVIPDCAMQATPGTHNPSRAVVIGRYGTEFDPTKGLLIVGGLLEVWVLVRRRIRAMTISRNSGSGNGTQGPPEPRS